MTRFAGILLVSTALVVTSAAGGVDNQSANRHFLGLWEGVDVNDGSRRTVSITDRNGDGILEVASHDSYWTLCDGDRGIELATGSVRRDGVLETDGLVTCFENAQEVPVRQTYEFSRQADTLFATPHGTPLTPIHLHRVSP
ncbi:MAG TPA: hypothetical protein VLD67_06425 [Vicinamibacterales bacterium]|nr:hypothetical protein [Vicinamibacterales bacterium]